MSSVDEIKNRLDIVEFISTYVPSLKKAGRTYKGLCPFHSEKTPSFVVYADQQTWHCFGACSTGGDIFSFVMKQEGYDFVEALKFLAAKAGVALEERSPEQAESDKRRQKLLEMVSAAAQFYHKQLLQSPQAEFCRDYIARRGLSQDTMVTFQLGYAPNQWEGLKTDLLSRGYSEQEMIDGGLLVIKDENRPGYDRFRDRFITPIRDVRGRVIGFGARALHDGQQPKYLNSPQSVLFDKSNILFGLDIAKNAIRDSEQAVIVEGYMDVLQAHERGFSNVVAEMGTALTERQLKQLKRFSSKFVLALDSDSAGSAATLRGIDIARKALLQPASSILTAQGLIYHEMHLDAEIKIASMPDGKDPDDVLKSDPDLWRTLIETALPLVDYYIQIIIGKLDLNTAKGKSTAVKEILPLIKELSNSTEQTHYLQQLARLVKIDERTLEQELQRIASAVSVSKRQTPTSFSTKEVGAQAQTPPGNHKLTSKNSKGNSKENICLAMLLGEPGALNSVNQMLYKNNLDVLALDDFQNIENKALFLVIKTWAVAEDRSIEALTSLTDEYLQGHLAGLFALWHSQPNQPIGESVDKELPKMIIRMRRQALEKLIRNINLLQVEALEKKERESVFQYQQKLSEIEKTLQLLDKAHDALSIMGQRRFDNLGLKN